MVKTRLAKTLRKQPGALSLGLFADVDQHSLPRRSVDELPRLVVNQAFVLLVVPLLVAIQVEISEKIILHSSIH